MLIKTYCQYLFFLFSIDVMKIELSKKRNQNKTEFLLNYYISGEGKRRGKKEKKP